MCPHSRLKLPRKQPNNSDNTKRVVRYRAAHFLYYNIYMLYYVSKRSVFMSKHGMPAILASEPLTSFTIEQLRAYLDADNSENALADTYAPVDRKVGWLMHELDYDTCTPKTRLLFKEWSAFEDELRARIVDILKNEDIESYKRRVAENNGYNHVITPFMLRNGFRYGRGWWIK